MVGFREPLQHGTHWKKYGLVFPPVTEVADGVEIRTAFVFVRLFVLLINTFKSIIPLSCRF